MDRQRALDPVIASEAWQSAYELPQHKRTTAQRGLAVGCGLPRSLRSLAMTGLWKVAARNDEKNTRHPDRRSDVMGSQ